jgi:hypothetical protein
MSMYTPRPPQPPAVPQPPLWPGQPVPPAPPAAKPNPRGVASACVAGTGALILVVTGVMLIAASMRITWQEMFGAMRRMPATSQPSQMAEQMEAAQQRRRRRIEAYNRQVWIKIAAAVGAALGAVGLGIGLDALRQKDAKRGWALAGTIIGACAVAAGILAALGLLGWFMASLR